MLNCGTWARSPGDDSIRRPNPYHTQRREDLPHENNRAGLGGVGNGFERGRGGNRNSLGPRGLLSPRVTQRSDPEWNFQRVWPSQDKSNIWRILIIPFFFQRWTTEEVRIPKHVCVSGRSSAPVFSASGVGKARLFSLPFTESSSWPLKLRRRLIDALRLCKSLVHCGNCSPSTYSLLACMLPRLF